MPGDDPFAAILRELDQSAEDDRIAEEVVRKIRSRMSRGVDRHYLTPAVRATVDLRTMMERIIIPPVDLRT